MREIGQREGNIPEKAGGDRRRRRGLGGSVTAATRSTGSGCVNIYVYTHIYVYVPVFSSVKTLSVYKIIITP